MPRGLIEYTCRCGCMYYVIFKTRFEVLRSLRRVILRVVFCGFGGWMHVRYVYSQGGIEDGRHVCAM